MTQKGLRAYLLFMIFFFLIESQQWSLVVFLSYRFSDHHSA